MFNHEKNNSLLILNNQHYHPNNVVLGSLNYPQHNNLENKKIIFESNVLTLSEKDLVRIPNLQEYQSNFHSHYDKYQPILEELTDNVRQRNTNRTFSFALEDLGNLLLASYNKFTRYFYIKKTVPNCDQIKEIKEYENILNSLESKTDMRKMEHFYEFSRHNREARNEAITYSRDYLNNLALHNSDFITTHRSYRAFTDSVSNLLNELDIRQLEFLKTFVEKNETFALLTLEPIFICAVGYSLFFDIVLPLHSNNCFTYIMFDIIKARKNALFLKTEIPNRNIFSRWYYYVYDTLEKPSVSYYYNRYNKVKGFVADTSNSAISFIPAPIRTVFYNYIVFKSVDFVKNKLLPNRLEKIPSTLVSDLVKKTILGGEGQGHPVVEKIKKEIQKICFTLGDYMNSSLTSFIRGFFHGHEEAIVKGAKEIDKYLSKKADKSNK